MAVPGTGSFQVVGGAAVVRTLDGSERYLYKGAVFDAAGADAASIEHLVSVGLISDVTPQDDSPPPVEIPEGAPADSWSAKQLEAYAAAHGIDLASAKNKAAKLAAILAATDSGADASDDGESADAAGDDEATGATAPAESD